MQAILRRRQATHAFSLSFSTGKERPVSISKPLPHPQQSALTFLSQMPCLFQYHPFYFSVLGGEGEGGERKKKKKNHKNRFKRKKQALMSKTVCSPVSFSGKSGCDPGRDGEAQQLPYRAAARRSAFWSGAEPPNSTACLPARRFLCPIQLGR